MSLLFPAETPVIKIPSRIQNSFVKLHRELIFIYSNDRLDKGCEGMAWHFAKESNTFMVPTMNKMCHSATDKYFKDDCGWHKDCIIDSLVKIPKDGRPIIPVRKIGAGCSRMREYCPKLYEFLWSELKKLEYPYIEWV